MLNKTVENVFKGSPSELFMHLVKSEKMTESEKKEIKKNYRGIRLMMDLLYRTDFLGHLIKINILWSIYAILLFVLLHVLIKEARNRYNYLWVIYISVLPLTILSYFFDFFLIPFPQAEQNFIFFYSSALSNQPIDYVQWSIFLSISIAFIMYLIRLYKFISVNQQLQLEFNLGKELNVDLADLTIRVSSLDCSPYVYGVFKPVIVLPEQVINSLSPADLEIVILHEKQHIIHHDYLKNVMQKSIRALLYFNPLILFLDHYLDDLRESACDMDVIAMKGGSKEYAQTLYLINEMVQQKVGGLATVPFIRKTSQLKRRILRMRNVQKKR